MEMPETTKRFVADAAALGLDVAPVVYPDGTKTAADAAAAIGCEVAAIVKSLLFMADDEPVLVLMAGDRRVDAKKLADLRGSAKSRRASLDEVRVHTGFVAGGTPPFCHPEPLPVLADNSLRRNESVWAAGGTPTTVFEIDLDVLVDAAAAEWVSVAED